jgi:hypothetical protein
MNAKDSDPRVTGPRDAEPSADDEMKNDSPGDGIMEDVLTEERDVSPEEREEVAHTQVLDP